MQKFKPKNDSIKYFINYIIKGSYYCSITEIQRNATPMLIIFPYCTVTVLTNKFAFANQDIIWESSP